MIQERKYERRLLDPKLVRQQQLIRRELPANTNQARAWKPATECSENTEKHINALAPDGAPDVQQINRAGCIRTE
jgi:hypothetical protein